MTPMLIWKNHRLSVLTTYIYRIHNFDLTSDNLVNMYILCFLQVVFPYFEKNKKIKKRVKIPKRKIKGLKKNRPQKKKMKIRHESVQVPNATTFYFLLMIMAEC